MRLSHRPQALWKDKPDNSILEVSPSLLQIEQARKFSENM